MSRVVRVARRRIDERRSDGALDSGSGPYGSGYLSDLIDRGQKAGDLVSDASELISTE